MAFLEQLVFGFPPDRESGREVLARSAPMDAAEYSRGVLRDVPVEWVVHGSATATIEVRKEPQRAN